MNSLFKNATICLLLALLCLLSAKPTKAQTPIQVAGTANKTAVASGDWTSTATWGGSLPATDARILIPAGITVTVNGEISTEFKSLRIAGILKFATDVNTELRVEYIVSTMTGRLEIGTATHPIADGVTAKLVFADRGGTTSSQDKERFAPGAVLMGPVEMRGQEKTSWTTLSVHPNAGANSLSLASSPLGWKTGDKLVVAATDINDPASDDLVEISSINGTTINLTSSLLKSHKAPAQASDLDVHVANLTRNIQISSENQSVAVKRRGHIMFMHNLNVDVRYVELDHIGRTDKVQGLDDYTWDDLQEDPAFNPPEGAFTNPRGRYSLHFHRGGVDPALTPARVEGVTVNNDPGWGFVNHSSRVDFVKNVSYDVVGGAFNTEAGDETGSFIENIALRTVNPTDPFSDLTSEDALLDAREDKQDYAWQGDAFWFHSAGVTVEGNIAAGVSGHAFIFWPEGLIEKGLGMMRGTIDYHVTDPTQAAMLNGVPNNFVLECWLIPSKPFKNNTAYTSTKGLSVYYLQTRFLEEDSDFKANIPTQAYRNSLNADFDGTTIWNIRHKGIEMLYASDITIKNSRIVGHGSASSVVGMDLDHFHNLDDWFFLNNTVEGFNNSNIGFSPPTNATVTIDGGDYNNSATDIRIRETNFSLFHEGPLDEAFVNRTMTISNMVFSNANNNIVLQPEFTLNQPLEDGFDFADEIKYLYYFGLDDDITLNYGPFQNAKLYYNEQAANFIPITNSNYQPETPPDEPAEETIPTQYRNKTNAQLQSIFNPPTSFGGELLPATAVSHPSIVGGKVSAISGNPCSGVIPSSPSSLTASNNGCNSVSLTWSSANCADTYRVQRKVDSGSWVTLSSSVTGTTYTDNNPVVGNLSYRIRAQNSNGNSTEQTSNTIDCVGTVDPCEGVTPSIPSSLTASNNGCNSVSLAWSSANCADTYRVQRKVDVGSWVTLSASVTDTTYTDSNPAVGNLSYRVRSQNSNGNSAEQTSNTIDCVGTVDPCEGVTPPTPSFLTASNNGCNSVSLAWSSTNCADSYRMQRKIDSGTWITLSASITDTTYTDSNPSAGVLSYRVRAQNSNGNSGNKTSNTIDCTETTTQYTLTTSTSGTGSGTISLSSVGGIYDEGTVVTVTAIPNANSQFDNWSGAASGTNNPTTITMNSNQSITAHFSEIPPTGDCTWTTIDSNDFESGWGTWNDGGSDCRRNSNDAQYASNGNYCVRLRDNTNTSVMTTDDLDLSEYNELKVEFSYYCRSMDNSNEDFWLQVSTNGGSSFTTVEEWNRNDEFVNNQFYTDEVTISDITFTPNTRLRFRCDASGNADWVYIDEVVISACSTGDDDNDDDDSIDGVVEVVNFSFEEPGEGDFEDDFSVIPGWSKSGSGDSSLEKEEEESTDGDWVCFHEAGDDYIYQTLNHAIEAGMTYTLEIDAKGLEEEEAIAQIQLRHGNTNIQELEEELSEDWQTLTVSFEADDYPSAIGENLRIFFRNNGETDTYAAFDNVRLTKTSVATALIVSTSNIDAKTVSRSSRTLKAFPNPIHQNQILQLQVTGFEPDAVISIFNANGQLLEEKSVREISNISTENFPIGLYFLKVIDKTGSLTTRFLVKE